MKKTIFYSLLVIGAIGASLFIFKSQKKEEVEVVAQVEIVQPSSQEKVSTWVSKGSRGYYADALEDAFKKALLDNPALINKVNQWRALRDELEAQQEQYYQVINYYQQFDQAAKQRIQQSSDSTQILTLKAKIAPLQAHPDLALALERVKALSHKLAQMDDYMIKLKIDSTVGMVQEGVSYAPDEVAQFEALVNKTQGFLSD